MPNKLGWVRLGWVVDQSAYVGPYEPYELCELCRRRTWVIDRGAIDVCAKEEKVVS